MKLHTGDTVVIISGEDKGKTGSIMRVLPEERRVVISGANIRTRHIKKTFEQAGRIIHYEASLAASKVMLIDPKTKKRTRVGYAIDEKGGKKRISRLSGEEIVRVKAMKTEKKPAAKKVTEGTETGAAIETKTSAPATPTPSVKQPFWKRLKFGAAAVEQGAATEGSRMQQDHTIPGQNIPRKSSGRGS
ncbi:50S ribosomal protein L24 [Candidatus Peregrinibacteria bacterium]|nr:50S ribosomal protein L24 [Candidatus Peregrinibacteria bacterium]MBI3815934.1 50S ribosomal protein L24 [Candidatus Peregrinibacteria bacterium]